MTYLLQKHKNIAFLILLLIFSLAVWYIYTNKNTNTIPKKANLVLGLFNTTRGI